MLDEILLNCSVLSKLKTQPSIEIAVNTLLIVKFDRQQWGIQAFVFVSYALSVE